MNPYFATSFEFSSRSLSAFFDEFTNKTVIGTGGADVLSGKSGNDALYGNGGNDFLSGEEKTINWFIPDFGIGSGGHLNIFRFIQMLEKEGYKSTICIVGAHRHESPFQARALISEHFFKLQAYFPPTCW